MTTKPLSFSQVPFIECGVAEKDFRFNRVYRGGLGVAGFAALLLISTPVLAATAPALGTISSYAVVTDTLNNTNPTVINGDLCYNILGGGIPTVTGGTGTYTGACTTTPLTDQTTALGVLTGQACTDITALAGGGTNPLTLNTVVVPGGTPAGTFPPGCYTSNAIPMRVGAGAVTLSGAGVYIFKTGAALDTAAGTSVGVAAGACENDVFWAPGGATTLTGTSFVGNILSDNAITVAAGGTVSGRLLGYLGVLTTSGNTITKPSCTTVYPASIPTLSEWAMIIFALLLVGLGLQMQRRRQA